MKTTITKEYDESEKEFIIRDLKAVDALFVLTDFAQIIRNWGKSENTEVSIEQVKEAFYECVIGRGLEDFI